MSASLFKNKMRTHKYLKSKLKIVLALPSVSKKSDKNQNSPPA